jgi:hypothetical protein
VMAIWKGQNEITRASFIAYLDARSTPANYPSDTVKNATMLQSISTSNYLYSNLRVLRKSFDFIISDATLRSSLPWSAWHLDILKQMDMNLRNEIKKVSGILSEVARKAHVDILRELGETGQIDSNGRIQSNLTWKTDKGHTPFAVYRSLFWEHAKQQADVLNGLLEDTKVMDFIIIMSSVTFGADPVLKQLARYRARDVSELINNWPPLGIFSHLGWLLHFSN